MTPRVRRPAPTHERHCPINPQSSSPGFEADQLDLQLSSGESHHPTRMYVLLELWIGIVSRYIQTVYIHIAFILLLEVPNQATINRHIYYDGVSEWPENMLQHSAASGKG